MNINTVNPFKILGLDPSSIRGLDDNQIRILIHGVYRTLARLHHEDVTGGDNVKIRLINSAFDILKDEQLFAYHKQQFLKRRRDKIVQLEDELRLIGDEIQDLEQQFLRYCRAFAKSNGAQTVFNLVPMRILIFNSLGGIINGLSRIDYTFSGKKKLPNNLELEICEDGSLWIYKLNMVYFNPNKEDCPELPRGWLSKKEGSQAYASYYIERTGKKIELEAKIIGILKKHEIFAEEKLKNFRVLLSDKKKVYKELEFEFSWQLFKPYFKYLSPEIEKDGILVAISKNKNKTEEDDYRFIILGQILAIWPM